jgi:hypothetical protein
MPARKPPPDSVFARVVEARAAGASWAIAAAEAGRAPDTIRKWPNMYPERWAEALRAAGRSVIEDAAAEAVHVLRDFLRSKVDKVRLEAAWRLIYQRLEQCRIEQAAGKAVEPDAPSDAHRIAEFVKGHTHEQLLELLANLFATRIPLRFLSGALPPRCAG